MTYDNWQAVIDNFIKNPNDSRPLFLRLRLGSIKLWSAKSGMSLWNEDYISFHKKMERGVGGTVRLSKRSMLVNCTLFLEVNANLPIGLRTVLSSMILLKIKTLLRFLKI